MHPRLIINHKKSIVAIALFDASNSLFRALHDEVMAREKFSVIRFASVGGSNKGSVHSRRRLVDSDSMAYSLPACTNGVVDLPAISDIVESTLKTRLFNEQNMRKICHAAVLEDQVQFVVMATPRSTAEMVQTSTFLQRLASAATNALGFDARRSIHYANVLLLGGDQGKGPDKGLVLRSLFPGAGAIEFDNSPWNSPSQLVRPTLVLSNRMGGVRRTIPVAQSDLVEAGCVHEMCRMPTDELIAHHIQKPGKWMLPFNAQDRGKIVVHHAAELTKKATRRGANEQEPSTLPIPVTVYETLLGLPLNATGRAPETLRRNHLLNIEPSQFHIKHLLLKFHDVMDPASLRKNKCSYVGMPPREIAAGPITRPWHPNKCSKKEEDENEEAREEIQKAIDDILPPTKPRDLVGHGFQPSWSNYC